MALVAGQDVEPADEAGRWRIARRTAPDRVISTVDPESRHAHKTSHSYRDGYKAHVAVEPDTGLVTDYDLTAGNTGDADAAAGLVDNEPEGTEVLGDSAYGTGELRDHLQGRDITAVIKPPPLRPAVEGGYTIDDFDIDLDTGCVTCPAGITVQITQARNAYFGANCDGCPLRHRCTTATGGRTLHLHPHHDLLVQARAQARTDEFDTVYRQHRPMVERSLAWLVKGPNRRVRYHGTQRNQIWWSMRCAAINLQRLITLGLTHQGTWAIG